MDQTDIKILALLQKDATCSVAEIAEQVNLSATPCWRRIQKLKDDGVIARNAILLDPRALGLNLTVFVSIKTSQHNEKWTQSLINAVMALPNVVERITLRRRRIVPPRQKCPAQGGIRSREIATARAASGYRFSSSARIALRRILPLMVFGSSSTNSMMRGYL